MAKITSNEYVRIAWVLDANMTPTQAAAPPEDILQNALTVELSEAIAWQDFAMGATESDDIDDRGITDSGNAVSRGFANFEASLSFFYDQTINTDVNSPYVKAFNAFRTPRTYGYMVMRVARKKWNEAWAAGDVVSVFRFIADVIVDDTEGEDSYKFSVQFLPQAILHTNTVVAASTPAAISGVGPTAAMSIGDVDVLAPTLSGADIRGVSKYMSDDTAVATVSPNGVVKAISAGTANITVSHPGATADVTQAVTVS